MGISLLAWTGLRRLKLSPALLKEAPLYNTEEHGYSVLPCTHILAVHNGKAMFRQSQNPKGGDESMELLEPGLKWTSPSISRKPKGKLSQWDVGYETTHTPSSQSYARVVRNRHPSVQWALLPCKYVQNCSSWEST